MARSRCTPAAAQPRSAPARRGALSVGDAKPLFVSELPLSEPSQQTAATRAVTRVAVKPINRLAGQSDHQPRRKARMCQLKSRQTEPPA